MMRTARARPALRLALASLLVALALSTNYLLINVPNVKLMDLLVFAGAYLMGPIWGSLVGAMTWIVYGTLNPYGTNMLTLVIVITGELFYVIAAYLASRASPISPRSLMFGFLGGLFTLAYDLYTNALTGILFYGSFWAGIITMNFPLPVGLMHQLSNVLFFGIAGPPIISILSLNAKPEISEAPPIKLSDSVDRLSRKLVLYLREPWIIITCILWTSSMCISLYSGVFPLATWLVVISASFVLILALMLRPKVDSAHLHALEPTGRGQSVGTESQRRSIAGEAGIWPTVAVAALIGCLLLASLSLYLNSHLVDMNNRVAQLESFLSRHTVRSNLLINFGNGTRRWFNSTRVPNGSNLLNLTVEALGSEQVDILQSQYGSFVSSIGEVGGKITISNHVWLWWKWNSEEKEWQAGQVGADAYTVSDGEIVAWYYQDVSKWPELENP